MKPKEKNSKTSIIIISGGCCIPGMASLDEKAKNIVNQAISETGADAEVNIMPASTAYFNGAFKEIMNEAINNFNKNKSIGLPAILINGKMASSGIPSLEIIKSHLKKEKNE